MRSHTRRRYLLSLLTGLLLILSSCGIAEMTFHPTADTKTINIGVTFSPNSLNPLSPAGQVSSYIAGLMYLPLVELDDDLTFKSMLADSITTTDQSVFTIHLNQDATWSDGTPITADDVIYTLKLMTNRDIASNYAYMFGIIEGVDSEGYMPKGQSELAGVQKVDEHTLTIKTKAPTTLIIFQDTIGRDLLTLSKAELEDESLEMIKQGDFVQKSAVTSGPYKLDSYEKDKLVQMTANKAYFKGEPHITRLNVKVLPSSIIAAQLQNGKIDMNIPSFGVIPIQDHGMVKSLSDVTTIDGPSIATQLMYINEQVLPSAKQRKAISCAINRERIVNNLLRGAGETVDGFFTSYSPYVDPSVMQVEYNPDKAKSLLAESGWQSGTKLTLSVLSGDSTLEQAARMMGDDLKAVGIDVNIQMLDFASLVDRLVKKDYDLGIMTVAMSLVNPLPDIAYFLQKGNPNGYANPEVNKVLSSLQSETEETAIKQAYSRLQQITAEDVPMPSIYATRALGAVNHKVIGATPKDYGMFINVENWDIKR